MQQTQSSQYPVTAELRTAALLEWRSSNASKSKRAIDRIKDDYTSGRKDKEIYEASIKQHQALQAQAKLELRQSVQDLARKQQREAREQRRQDLEAERKVGVCQDSQLRQSAQELERQLQKTVSRQKREGRQREREAREQREAYEQQVVQVSTLGQEVWPAISHREKVTIGVPCHDDRALSLSADETRRKGASTDILLKIS